MKPDDFFVIPPKAPPRLQPVYAGVNFVHFEDECYVLSDGVVELPHARFAENLARDTALWAYRVVRTRPYYWDEKPDLMKRIFRSTNLTLWQKRRDPGYEEGIAASLLVLFTIEGYFWVGSAGNCNAFLYRDGLIDVLTKHDGKAAGFARPQLIPQLHSERFIENDIVLLATDSIVNFVTEDQMRDVFENVGSTKSSIENAIHTLCDIAKNAGSIDEMSACMVKRIML